MTDLQTETQNASFKPLTSKCDLDLRGKDLGLAHDTSSDHGESLWQIISKCLDD